MLAHQWGKPMFEVRPDLFPEGFLTSLEIELWNLFYTDMENTREK